MSTIRQALADRIRQMVTSLRQVDGAADLEEIGSARLALPAALVVRGVVSTHPSRVAGGVVQDMAELYQVAIIVPSQRGVGEASDAAEAIADAIRAALVGYEPEPDMVHPLEYAGGRLVQAGKNGQSSGILVWLDNYQLTRQVRVFGG